MNMGKQTIYTIIQVVNKQSSHRSVTVLQAIKGKGRQACCRTTCRDLQTFVDFRRLPDWCSAYGKLFNRGHNASSDRCRFRTSSQEGLHIRTTSPTLSCSCFIADSHDHLEFLQTWLSATGTITFKLFDAPLHESSAANSTIFASVDWR